MISESGPPRWTSEDDTPTQVFGPLVMPDDTELGTPRTRDETAAANGTRDEHGLTALLTKEARSLVPPRTRERRTVKITAALGVVMLAVIGVATYEVVAGLGHAGKATGAQSLAAHSAVAHSAVAHAANTAAASPGTGSTPSAIAPSASKAASAPPVAAAPERTLRVVSATALGPGGMTGDNPQGAQNVLTGHGPGWQTDWYVTPVFGGLRTGTGLLLDLGGARTVSRVTVTLGSIPGANFEIRAGDTASSSLRVVATSAGPAGTVQLTLAHSAQARYLMIWFTRLPPDGAGHYQVKVYQVTVWGHS